MEGQSAYLISQGLFLKAIAVIYMIAFISLAVQAKGLYGANGILPLERLLTATRKRYPKKNLFLEIPSIFWFKGSDRTLIGVCLLGVCLGGFAMIGILPAFCLAALWVLYGSFYFVGSPFLNFQWDALLLETGFLAVLFSIQSPPPLLMVYLLWFLLFRFLFSSGLAKLVWGSKEWKDLTAMDYHYETQPLPTRLGYYAHQQPKWISKLSVLGTYFFELVVPVLIFTPDSVRIPVFWLMVLFQIMIMLTGNYAFFNLLTIALCLPLLPDDYLRGLESISRFTPLVGENIYVEGMLTGVAAFILLLNVLELLSTVVNLGKYYKVVVPFKQYSLINGYGLFVKMTTWRDEIIIEGSEDGNEWKAYEFRWKPGALDKPPMLVAPHQPRLDWQMWFAALSHYSNNPWFIQLLYRLLEGSEDVLGLLGNNPFPGNPPRYIRVLVYRYHFTDMTSHFKEGRWWSREYVGEYCPRLQRQAP